MDSLLEIRDLDVTFEHAHAAPAQAAGAAAKNAPKVASRVEPGAKAAKTADVTSASRNAAYALRGIDLRIEKAQVHSLVGESGSGKTVTATCVMGLLPAPPGMINRGQIHFLGRNLLERNEAERRKVRGKQIAMIFQEPAKHLNPALRNGEQIAEMLTLHLGMDRSEAQARALELLELVGLRGGKRVLRGYPHELSGGMKQRLMIAMAVSCNPALLIADEPTTALDVTLQKQILKLILDLRERFSMGILFISHDLGVVHDISERVSVIYAGKIVESAERRGLFGNPLHPYTRLLLASIPDATKRGKRLQAIPGTVPDAEHVPPGCAFHPRCPLTDEICRIEVPPSLVYGQGAAGEVRREATGGMVGREAAMGETAVPMAAGGRLAASQLAGARSANGAAAPIPAAHSAACHMIGKKWLDL